jgi:NAD(P)-dependent dehydrogenase (short-subunit alcohol dehydrogenase family)
MDGQAGTPSPSGGARAGGPEHTRRTAIVTGASAGLGRALARLLARDGWRLVIDARRPEPLATVQRELTRLTDVIAVPGDIADHDHRSAVAAAGGDIDLLINNASDLGASPLPRLRNLTAAARDRLWQVNVDAPLALLQVALPFFASGAVVINISSDAAVEHYENWGGYGASKAALDHLTLTLAAEEPQYRFYAVDPGDMRTAMHQAAFPGEDISDRPSPASVAPRLVELARSRMPSGRYRAADLPDPPSTRRIVDLEPSQR